MSPQREEIEPVRRQRGGIGRDHNTLPVADPARHRRYVGVAAGELLRRIDTDGTEALTHLRPLGIDLGPNLGPVIHRQGGNERAHGALCGPHASGCKPVTPSAARLAPARCPPPWTETAAHPWTERAARFRLAPEHGVCHRFLGAEGMVPEQRQIARIGVARVHFQPFLAPRPEQRRQIVPGGIGQLVVDQMEIVVEKQQRERRMLHDDRAPVRPFRPLVLGKGADGDQRLAEPGRHQHIKPERHLEQEHDDRHDHGEASEMV